MLGLLRKISLLSLGALAALSSCQQQTAGGGKPPMFQPISNYGPIAQRTPSQLKREVNLRVELVPNGKYSRRVYRPMRARYITIHSTQNYASSADAVRHSIALRRGALRGGRIGYMSWHFTVDENRAVQHLPLNEQGDHADVHGPGNKYSIGIEMCENAGSRLAYTVDRTAKLTAVLMYELSIPISNVVPHYHWARPCRVPHKNCPHFLMDNGRPGYRWAWFQNKVNRYYKAITTGEA